MDPTELLDMRNIAQATEGLFISCFPQCHGTITLEISKLSTMMDFQRIWRKYKPLRRPKAVESSIDDPIDAVVNSELSGDHSCQQSIQSALSTSCAYPTRQELNLCRQMLALYR